MTAGPRALQKKAWVPIVVLALGRFFQALFSFVSVRLLASMLSPGEIGRQSIFNSLGSTLSLIMVMPLSTLWNRRLFEWWKSGALPRVSKWFGLYHLLLIAPSVGVVFLIERAGLLGTRVSFPWIVVIAAGSFATTSVVALLIAALNLLGFRVAYVGLSNGVSWIGLASAMFFATRFGHTAEYWIAGSLVPRVFVALLILPAALVGLPRESKNGELDVTQLRREVTSFCMPLVAYAVLYNLQVQTYPMLFGMIASEATLGHFAIGLAVGGTPVVMYGTLFSEYYNPIFYASLSERNTEGPAVERYLAVFLPGLVSFGLCVGACSPGLTRLMAGANYAPQWWLAVWGAMFQCILLGVSTLNLGTQAGLRTSLMVVPTAAAAAVTIGGLMLMLPIAPLWGGAVVLNLGAMTSAVIQLRYLRRAIDVRIPWRRIAHAAFLTSPVLVVTSFLLTPSIGTSKTLVGLALAGIWGLSVQVVLVGRNLSAASALSREMH